MAHLIPEADYFSLEQARQYLQGQREYEEIEAGWYGRLSAPGYLDCTDWQGPYTTADEALKDVMDEYEVDGEGNPTDE